jgi:hypothetical protein
MKAETLNLPTQGEWKWKQTRGNNDYEHKIYVFEETIADLDGENSQKVRANAELIVTAVNACKEINPANPLAAARAAPELLKALEYVLTHVPNYGIHPHSEMYKIVMQTIQKATP